MHKQCKNLVNSPGYPEETHPQFCPKAAFQLLDQSDSLKNATKKERKN